MRLDEPLELADFAASQRDHAVAVQCPVEDERQVAEPRGDASLSGSELLRAFDARTRKPHRPATNLDHHHRRGTNVATTPVGTRARE